MKGGITSGVVYPLALVALAKDYRFSSIGGTSAGAMAAAAAASAEYGRQTSDGGFKRLEKVPDEIGPNLLELFQPTPELKPLFDIFVASLKGKSDAVVAALGGYSRTAINGAAAGIIVAALIAVFFNGGSGIVAFGIPFAILGVLFSLVWRLYTALFTELPANDFGVCPGIQQPGGSGDGFTDWLAKLIDEAAGRGSATAQPLTFGDLEKPSNGHAPIHLAMMTTSLMERRPYTLPMTSRAFFFKESEWARLFPKRIMDFLKSKCKPFTPLMGEEGNFFHFPQEDDLPIVVAARMSLSFPGLISAVPLWRQDHIFKAEDDKKYLRRCLFSDGGLSSNFPIHFFDHLLPNIPTFAISLDEHDPKRYDKRVRMPDLAHAEAQIPIKPFSGLLDFLGRLIDAAKDWQDNLQSLLPGYRERIVHIGLEPKEGGLNLTMDKTAVDRLAQYGQDAGDKLRTEFDMNEHRWRRFLVAMARVEETLDEMAKAYEGTPACGEAFAAFLKHYANNPAHYKQRDPARLAAILKRGEQLASIGKDWRQKPIVREGAIPRPETNLRITPKP